VRRLGRDEHRDPTVRDGQIEREEAGGSLSPSPQGRVNGNLRSRSTFAYFSRIATRER
jgi:hypothetical protein